MVNTQTNLGSYKQRIDFLEIGVNITDVVPENSHIMLPVSQGLKKQTSKYNYCQ